MKEDSIPLVFFQVQFSSTLRFFKHIHYLGVSKRISMIGIAEKGYYTIQLSLDTVGGHSSMPPKETAIGILSAAVSKLEQNPLPSRITKVSEETFQHVASEYSFGRKILISNLWLFSKLVCWVLEKTPGGNALCRTTTAATLFNSGTKANVLPQKAKATFNFRSLPGDTIQDIISHIKRVVADDRIAITPVGFQKDASAISRTDTYGWHLLTGTILDQHPDVIISPYLVLGTQ